MTSTSELFKPQSKISRLNRKSVLAEHKIHEFFHDPNRFAALEVLGKKMTHALDTAETSLSVTLRAGCDDRPKLSGCARVDGSGSR